MNGNCTEPEVPNTTKPSLSLPCSAKYLLDAPISFPSVTFLTTTVGLPGKFLLNAGPIALAQASEPPPALNGIHKVTVFPE